MWVNSDFSELLSLFNAFQVRYLVVGGYAVIRYTEPRFTKDLDLWIEASPTNAHRVYHALRQFGAPLSGMSEGDFAEEGYFYQMGVPPLRIDILMSIQGVRFADAWEHRAEMDFEGLRVSFISRQDLILAKRAAGRLQDLVDVQLLIDAEQSDAAENPSQETPPSSPNG